jgi:hypothetical protein
LILLTEFVEHRFASEQAKLSRREVAAGQLWTQLYNQTKQSQKDIHMNKSLIISTTIALSTLLTGVCLAQSDAPYTEGPVWTVTMVKTKPGMSDDYLKTLAKIYKATNDEAKKQGIIMDYKILLGDASTPHDFDILLMQEFKNMAAFDGVRDKIDPIENKIIGNADMQRQGAVQRMQVREIMGNKIMREITLK